jgi:hypothetical protein
MDTNRLRRHLTHDHGRTEGEIAGLPIAELHRFEHVEQSMGLITLAHRHGPDGIGHRELPRAQRTGLQ